MEEVNIFRIHINPKGGEADMEITFEYCKKNNILGFGWRVDYNKLRYTKNWDEYERLAKEINHDKDKGWKNATDAIRKIKPGDLIWTRDPNANYYLCRALSKWRYEVKEEANKKNIDIGNIFDCEFELVRDISSVPGKVIASFRAGSTLQSIKDENVCEYSKYLWNKLTNSETYKIDYKKINDIFTFLDDIDTENLVAMYLQKEKGLIVIPKTWPKYMKKFEGFLVNPENGEFCAVQVKTGRTPINVEDYETDFKDKKIDKIYLFQSNEKYS